MGIGGIGMGELLIVLIVVLLIFGTKRLKTIGSDLGGAIKGFRSAMSDGERATEKPGGDQGRSGSEPQPNSGLASCQGLTAKAGPPTPAARNRRRLGAEALSPRAASASPGEAAGPASRALDGEDPPRQCFRI